MLKTLFTPEVIESFRRKWLQIGLATDPVDRSVFAQRISRAYQLAGMDAPKQIVWFESPMAAILFIAVLRELKVKQPQVRDQVSAQVSDQVLAQVLAQVSDQVRAQVRDQVLAQVLAQVSAQVRDQVLAQVLAQVSDQVSAQVRDQVLAQVSDQVRAQVSDQVLAQVSDQVLAQVSDRSSFYFWRWGTYDEYWLSYCDLFTQTQSIVLHEDVQARLYSLTQVREASGIFFSFRELVVCSDNPDILLRDERGRLHNETGPAMRYRDGWSIYAVHGVRVPEYVIERPHEISVSDIEKEPNAEIRRVKMERYGQSRFLLDSGATAIHSDDYGTLYCKRIEGDEPLMMVKVVNSTPEADGTFKDYFLRVPLTMRTAREAVAWTFGETAETYAPTQES